MKEVLTFDFCKMSIYDHYLIVVINEGIDITPSHNDVLVEVTEKHFADRPFVYITHRVNSYSVDPQIYFETSKIENLKGFAVVSSNYKAKVNAKIEQMFFKKPFQIFTELDEAVSWAGDLLKK
ncbi:MAG: hypothetical protein AB8B52_09425 [Winogradskyella sp.]|uniref:hypothetical protein n=1 Tax=Winogradskyella sp. TaxID=1883156 RepID=UPI00385CF9C1